MCGVREMRLSETDLSAFQAREASRGNVKPLKLKRQEPKESDIQASILRALRVHPAVAFFWRQNTGAMAIGEGKARRFVRFGPKGMPDICGFLTDGRALYIECKTRTGRVSPEQQEFHDKAKRAGCVAIIARSVADVWEVLDGVLRGQKDSAQKELASS